MNGLNDCNFIGRLTKDPEVRNTTGGKKVANFSIAVEEKFRDKDGNEQKNVEYLDCAAWGGLANVVESFLKRGSAVFIKGKYQTQTWEHQGATHRAVKILVGNLNMLDSKPNN